jgi:hypothetical protein
MDKEEKYGRWTLEQFGDREMFEQFLCTEMPLKELELPFHIGNPDAWGYSGWDKTVLPPTYWNRFFEDAGFTDGIRVSEKYYDECKPITQKIINKVYAMTHLTNMFHTFLYDNELHWRDMTEDEKEKAKAKCFGSAYYPEFFDMTIEDRSLYQLGATLFDY